MSRINAQITALVADRTSPVLSATSSSLEELLSPLTAETFFADYWEKQTLVVHRDRPSYFESLFSLAEADRVLTTLACKYPGITLKNARSPVSSADYTSNGQNLDIPRVCQLYRDGATIAMAYLDTCVPSLTRLCRGLERDFRCVCQTNVYLTPAGAQGAKPHYDTHDVLIIQVAGSKRWIVYGTPIESPLSTQDFDPTLHELGKPTLEFVLHAGYSAYVPRGHVHEAQTTDELSLHVTAGVLQNTWMDMLLELVAEAALKEPLLRKSLPPALLSGSCGQADVEPQLRKLMEHVLRPQHVDASLEHFYEEFVNGCPGPVPGQLLQCISLDLLTADSTVGGRPCLTFRQWQEPGSIFVQTSGRIVSFPAHLEVPLRFALSKSPFTVGTLPGSLDGAAKLTLIGRLVLEGMVEVLLL